MALNALTAFARGQSWRARRGNRDGEFSGTADPVPYGLPGSWMLARLAGAPGCRDAIGGRQSIGRKSGNGEMAKWRSKCLERLDSRPEMVPRAWPIDPQAGSLQSSMRGGEANASRPLFPRRPMREPFVTQGLRAEAPIASGNGRDARWPPGV